MVPLQKSIPLASLLRTDRLADVHEADVGLRQLLVPMRRQPYLAPRARGNNRRKNKIPEKNIKLNPSKFNGPKYSCLKYENVTEVKKKKSFRQKMRQILSFEIFATSQSLDQTPWKRWQKYKMPGENGLPPTKNLPLNRRVVGEVLSNEGEE